MGLIKTKIVSQNAKSIIRDFEFMAEEKRREAAILIKQADQIDICRRYLEHEVGIVDYDIKDMK